MRILLVHGAWHGAWCWERVIAELEGAGHEAVAIDLPGHGAHAGEIAQRPEEYRDAVLDALQPDTVLVGHSMGGMVITQVADAAPERIRHLVYLAAFAPRDGESILEAYADEVDFAAAGASVSEDGALISVDSLEAATALFYADCDPADAAWAFERLGPEPLAMLVSPSALSRFDASAVPRTYILCRQDGAVPPDVQRGMAARLGVKPVELDAAHSPWLNLPGDVARIIVDAGI